jgi:hypothetical protein
MSIFWLPAAMIMIGAAMYAYGSRKRDPYHIYLIPPHAFIMFGGAIFLMGFTVLAVVYFKSPR